LRGNAIAIAEAGEFLETVVNAAVPMWVRLLKADGIVFTDTPTQSQKVFEGYLAGKEIPEHKKEALKRAFSIKYFSIPDISYFLEIPENLVRSAFERLGSREDLRILNLSIKGKVVNLRVASQVYGLQDQGINNASIAGMLETSADVVNYALKQRAIFEPRLVEGLRVLYGNVQINKPYKI